MKSKNESGFAYLTAILALALLIVSIAATRVIMVSDEAHQSKYAAAECQAYFLAQQAIMEKGLAYMATKDPSSLPLEREQMPDYTVNGIGRCKKISVEKVRGADQDNPFEHAVYYDLNGSGVASFYDSYGRLCDVERSVTLRVKLKYFSDYLYLTDIEKTKFNEVVWFWGRDTLDGRVHSNDRIAIKGRPVFYGPVSTCKDAFQQGDGYNPYFKYPPAFNVPVVLMPTEATSVREHANPFITDHNGQWITRIELQGTRGILIQQFRLGLPEENPENEWHFSAPNGQAIFVEGQVEILGKVSGRLTVGSAGNMWLVDNVKYYQTNDNNGFVGPGTSDMLGLVSEKNIIIANTPVNGKNNCEAGTSIIINAALLALNESFSFEDQNDEGDLFQGPTPDDRGIIYLNGSVSQKRRGYVHRSNHQNTGYGKEYIYDKRFDFEHPPWFPQVTTDKGGSVFDVVRWTEH